MNLSVYLPLAHPETSTKITSPEPPTIQLTTMANLPVTGNSILNMPLPDAKAAPIKFRGKSSKIKPFLVHYELLLEQNNVHDDKDKCELITRYCSTAVSDFIQALPSYTRKEWLTLRQELLTYYDADFDNKRYRVNDLDKLEKSCRSRYISDLGAWRVYGRTFITTAGWLLKKGKISDDEFAISYWSGIHKKLRRKLENWLVAANPQRDLTSPFTYDEINAAAEKVLMRDRFDANISDLDTDAASEDDRNESSDEDSDYTSDSDIEHIRRWKKRARRKTKRARRRNSDSDEDSDSDDAPRPRKSSKNPKRTVATTDEKEIEGMIAQLNSMKIDDPGYAGLVFRALKKDPDVMRVIRPPIVVPRPVMPNSPGEPRMAPRFADPPPHLANVGFGPSSRNFDDRRRPNGGGSKCFGCGLVGHRIGECPEVSEIVQAGGMKRDESGRMVHGNGQPIQRLFDEPIVDAYRRAKRAQNAPDGGRLSSNLVQIVSMSEEDEADATYYCNLPNYDSTDTETDDEDEYQEAYNNLVSAAVARDWGMERPAETYPVLRSEKKATQKRREVMDNVTLAPAERRGRMERKPAETRATKKEREAKDTAQKKTDGAVDRVIRGMPPAKAPSPAMVPTSKPVEKVVENGRARKRARTVDEPSPMVVDTRKPAFDGDRDDAIMEDVIEARPQVPDPGTRRPEARGSQIPPKASQYATQNGDKKGAGTRRSEISTLAQAGTVVERVLKTRIELEIGQILGNSKELSAMLINKLKPKIVPQIPAGIPPMVANIMPNDHFKGKPVARSWVSKNRGLLIQLQMKCEGNTITAIIDTGSQLNIVNKELCDSKITWPIDSYESIKIETASGDTCELEGMMKEVPLKCGEVYTEANLYVGDNMPFELLLGRPWQRDNLVTIDERKRGTYLVFKDPCTGRPRYPILVTPDPRLEQFKYEIPSWNLKRSPASYLITVDQTEPTIEGDIQAPTTPLGEGTSQTKPSTSASKIEHRETVPHCKPESSITKPKLERVHEEITPIESKRVQELKGINTSKTKQDLLPILKAQTPQSMSSGDTQNSQNIPPTPPLHTLPQNRTDSEVITTALADLPYLERTNSLHPLLLTTADGLLLGQSQDIAGQRSSDYLFLRGGLLDLSNKPSSAVTASYFVRAFTDLAGGPQPQWLSTYINETATGEPVSDDDVYWDQVMLTNAPPNQTSNLDERQTSRARPMQTIIEEHEPVTGDPERNLSNNPISSSLPPTTTLTPSDTIVTPSTQTALPVHSNANVTSDYSFSIEKHPFSTTTTIFREPILRSPPSSPPGLVRHRDDDSSSSSGKDADGDTDMDLEEADSVGTAEWEEMRKDLADDIRKEQQELLEEMRREDEMLDNEIKKGRSDEEIYASLRQNFINIRHADPTDQEMSDMQETYFRYLHNRPVPFQPASATSSDGINPALLQPVRQQVQINPASNSTFIHSPTPELAHPSNRSSPSSPPTLTLPPYRPLVPDNLRAGRTIYSVNNNKPLSSRLQPPLAVFMARPVATGTRSSETPSPEDSTEAQHGSQSTTEVPDSQTRQDTPFPDFLRHTKADTIVRQEEPVTMTAYPSNSDDPDEGGDDNTSMDEESLETPMPKRSGTRLPVPPSSEVPTRPNSPTPEVSEQEERRNRFQRARLVDRDTLLDNLRREVDNIILEREDYPQDSEDFKYYNLRIAETYERIKLLETEAVGKINPYQVYVLGLMYALNLQAEHERRRWTTIEENDKPLVSRSTPAGTLEYYIRFLIHSNMRLEGESPRGPIIFNQLSNIPQCPNRPTQTQDPRNIPIPERPYKADGANNWTKEAGRVRDIVQVDIRSATIVTEGNHVPSRQLRQFTEFDEDLAPFIFPGRILPAHRWPLDVQKSRATTIGERLSEMEKARRIVEEKYQEVYRTLNEREIMECMRPHVTLYKRITPDSPQLTTIKVDRHFFWSRLHPVWNPFVKPNEAAFLRGAQYFFHSTNRKPEAEEIETLLRTPHYDDWEARELVAIGALEGAFRRDEAFKYLKEVDNEHWEFHAHERSLRYTTSGDTPTFKIDLPDSDYLVIRHAEYHTEPNVVESLRDSDPCSRYR